jgi:prepilin-type N-terminal cleavage/methylation domain-containing protein
MLRSKRHLHKGFTLVELMVTLAVLAILIAIAAPSMEQMIRQNRLDADVQKIQTAFSFARSEAIKRSATVSVVPSATGWGGGWSVITDDSASNPNCVLNTAAGEVLLRVQDPLAASTDLILASSPASATDGISCTTAMAAPIPACISFARTGVAVKVDGSFLVTSVCLRDQSNPTGMFRAVTINSSGQPYLSKVKN